MNSQSELEEWIMDDSGKSDAEWWARSEILRLRAQLSGKASELDGLKLEGVRLGLEAASKHLIDIAALATGYQDETSKTLVWQAKQIGWIKPEDVIKEVGK